MPLSCFSLAGCPSLPFLQQQQEDSLEKVIKDTESLFKTREKEYQETIDQIEVRVSAVRAPFPGLTSQAVGIGVRVSAVRAPFPGLTSQAGGVLLASSLLDPTTRTPLC